jgi:hypothetical protein
VTSGTLLSSTRSVLTASDLVVSLISFPRSRLPTVTAQR